VSDERITEFALPVATARTLARMTRVVNDNVRAVGWAGHCRFDPAPRASWRVPPPEPPGAVVWGVGVSASLSLIDQYD
jgi:hypothetical protein